MLFLYLLFNHLELLELIKILLWVKINPVSISKLIKIHIVFLALELMALRMLIFVVLIHVIKEGVGDIHGVRWLKRFTEVILLLLHALLLLYQYFILPHLLDELVEVVSELNLLRGHVDKAEIFKTLYHNVPIVFVLGVLGLPLWGLFQKAIVFGVIQVIVQLLDI